MEPYPSPATVKSIKLLEQELIGSISGEVRFDDGSRAMYSTDGSNYRQVPIGVVIPKDLDDVVKTIAVCHKYGVSVLSRAGGTSLAGQCCNTAVVIDFSKYLNNILELDPQRKIARVQPGIILDSLRSAAETYHLTFAPDPATHTHNCIGGMIGNNSCGIHSVMGGKTVDNIEELDILTCDGVRMKVGPTSDAELECIISEGGRKGEIYAGLKSIRDKYADLIREKYPNIPRRVSGYNLDQLLPENGFNVARALVGSEGTCVVVLEATCRLVYSPPVRSLLVLGYPDVFQAGDHVMEVLASEPIALEGIDDRLIADMKKKGLHPEDVVLLPEGSGWLMVEFGGETREESDAKASNLMEELKKQPNSPSMKLFDDRKQEKMLWTIRESGLGATALVPGEDLTWEGWEDSAVPPEKVGSYLRDLRGLLDKFGYKCDLYGHFGQGCIHTRIDFDFFTEHGVETYRRFMDEATDLVLRYSGSLSGEHGDGQSRAMFLPKMFGDELIQAFREFKTLWDPDWRMNPGKVVDPYQIDQNLRLGTGYDPPQYETYFKYPDDKYSFSRATLRCVGVGKCRRLEHETMCPSFMVTREEMHSTRGRARLLFEMLEGDPLKNGWRNQHVWDALDLCLACKGCKGDCPVNVDMATYKAEFLAHYYEGRLFPLRAYVFGMIFKWARWAELAPGVANYFTHAPIFGTLFKKMLGMAPEREIPSFAPETFRQWFTRRGERNVGASRILFWPDTFNNHFFPETARAAVEVLEELGFNVAIPKKHLCCGRPLYDYGMLDQTKKRLREIMDTLKDDIRDGVLLVGLEPSCITTFRDELMGLFPNDEDAWRLNQQSYLLSEFLDKYAKHIDLPKLPRKAVVHAHCHHKTVLNLEAEENVLKRMGLYYDMLDSGCCGMAGAFGYTKDHYDVSIGCGERVLLPAVRDQDKSTIVLANGFSCREQIQQTTDRRAMHLAQVMKMAIDYPDGNIATDYPEKEYVRHGNPCPPSYKWITAGIVALGGLAIGAGINRLLNKRSKKRGYGVS
ncbi:FAD-binding oxidoreductase [bacterium]|nr:FAD-binding oxidoreductase [bacterium]